MSLLLCKQGRGKRPKNKLKGIHRGELLKMQRITEYARKLISTRNSAVVEF